MTPAPFQAYLPTVAAAERPELVKDVKQRYREWQQQDWFELHPEPALYLLRLTGLAGETGLGLLGLLSADAYGRGEILPHEAILSAGRDRQIQALCEQQAMTKPVLLTYRQTAKLKKSLEKALLLAEKVVDCGYLGYRFEYLALNEPAAINELQSIWTAVSPQLLVADGHHRLASSLLLKNDPQSGAPSRFPALLMPDEILSLNTFYRLIAPRPGRDAAELLTRLGDYFAVTDLGPIEPPESDDHETDDEARGSTRPVNRQGRWSLYLNGRLYRLDRLPAPGEADLDPVWFNDHVLPELFGIHDSRTDERIISRAMGARGKTLAAWAAKYPDHAIFAGQPITGEQFFALIEQRALLPPKSTCFYPRIPSGLVVHDWLV